MQQGQGSSPKSRAHVSVVTCVPTVLSESDPPSVRQLPRQADPQSLPGQVQPQEDEEVSTRQPECGRKRGPQRWVGDHVRPLLRRLEKEYAAMKSKEMEEQIEIKVSPRGEEQRDGRPLAVSLPTQEASGH